MSLSVNLNPTSEETQALLDTYLEREPQYPEVIRKSNPFGRFLKFFFGAIIIILNIIPALLLLVCRLPFRIIRYIRRRFFKRKKATVLNTTKDIEYDEWETLPDKKSEKKKSKHTEEYKLKREIKLIKKKWHRDQDNLNDLISLAVYEMVTDRTNGHKKALFILDQLKELPEQPEFKYDILYWNLGVILLYLKVENQAQHFTNLALENDYKPPKSNLLSNMKEMLPELFALVTKSGKGLYKEIKNCWA